MSSTRNSSLKVHSKRRIQPLEAVLEEEHKTLRRLPKYRPCIVLVLSLLLAVSALVSILFKGQALTQSTWSGWDYAPTGIEDYNGEVLLDEQPGFDFSSHRPLFAGASVSLAAAVLTAYLESIALLRRRPIEIVWYQRRLLMAFLACNALLAFAVMIAMSALHSRSDSRFYFRLQPSEHPWYPGVADKFIYLWDFANLSFDVETWACKAKGVHVLESVSDRLAAQCTGETISRIFSIPLCIFALGILAGVWWDLLTRESILTQWRATDVREDDEDIDVSDLRSLHL